MSRPPGSGQAIQALLCASIILVAASAAGGTAIGAPTTATQLTPVEIGAITAEPAALAFYAKDMGFFERQGIDARLNILLDPTQTVPAVVAGQIRFAAFPTAMLALAKSRGAPLKLVAAGALYRPKAPTTALVAAPGVRIRTARDLVGKRVAVDSLNTIAHVGLLRWLKRGGVSADQVRLSTMPFSQMLGPILRRQVTAAVLPEPYLTQTTARGARRVAPILNAVCTADCLLTIWIARRDVDAGLAVRYLNAIQAAAVWANKPANERRSAAILARYTKLAPSLIARTTRTKFATRLRLPMAQPWIDLYAEFGLIPQSFTVQDLLR